MIEMVIVVLPIFSHSLESLSDNMMRNMNVDGLYQQNLSLVNEEVDNKELTLSLSDSKVEGKNLSGSLGVSYSDDKNVINLSAPLSYTGEDNKYEIKPTISYTYKIDSSNQKQIETLDKEFQSYNLLMGRENSKNYIKSQVLNTLVSIESDKRSLFVLTNEYNQYLKSVERDTKLGKIVENNLNDIEANYKINDYKISTNNLESKIDRAKENFELMCNIKYSSSMVDELIEGFKNPEIVSADELSMSIQSNIKKYLLSQENLNYLEEKELGLKQSITGSINSNIDNVDNNYGAGITYKLNTKNFGLDLNTSFNTASNSFNPSISIGAHYTINKSSRKQIKQNEIEVMNNKIALEESKRNINKTIINFNRSVVEYNKNLELLNNKLAKDKAIIINKNKLFDKGLIVKDEIELCKQNIELDEMDIRLTQLNRESLNLNKQLILISGDK
jgi:hypothetical protein